MRKILIGCLILLTACQAAATRPTAAPAPTAVPSAEATPTPNLTAAQALPTSTLAPAPRLFTEEFDGELPNWAFVQVDNGQPLVQPRLESGSLLFDLSAPEQWVYALYDSNGYSDVRVDARVEDRGGADYTAGIVCRYSETHGWYEFNVYADQTYVLLYGQWLMPGVARFTPLVQAESEKIKAGENEIGLACKGDILIPYINGVQMRQRQEKTFALTGGAIGISASSFEDAAALAYDWVKVSEP